MPACFAARGGTGFTRKTGERNGSLREVKVNMTAQNVSVEEAFKQLLKLCGFDDGGGEKLWSASSTVLGNLSLPVVESLSKTAFGLANVADANWATLQAQLTEAGAALNLEHAQQLQLLSAGLLMRLISGNSRMAAQAALVVTTTACGNARKPVAVVNLTEQAEANIGRLSRDGRKRPDLTARSTVPVIAFSKIRPLLEPLNADTVDGAFKAAATEISSELKKIADAFSSMLSAAQSTIAIQDEELQHLWWLVGGRSVERNVPFSELDVNAKPLILAEELAAATQLIPGPAALRALFGRAGIEEKPIQIVKAINACDIEWLRSVEGRDGASPSTFPLHTALNRRLETGDSEKWVAGWTGATGIQADHKLPASELAVLFFRERLLRRG